MMLAAAFLAATAVIPVPSVADSVVLLQVYRSRYD